MDSVTSKRSYTNQANSNSGADNRNLINVSLDENRDSPINLKENAGFQNLLIIFHECDVVDAMLLDFLVGKANLEECLTTHEWAINLLVEHHPSLFQVEGVNHHLSEEIAQTLETILNESIQDTSDKLDVLRREIEQESNSPRKLDLREANLPYIDLEKARLQKADFWMAKLEETKLYKADLQGAQLQEADLEGAGLREAQMQAADLWGANLKHANLQDANLEGANLQDAVLKHAQLQRANLQEANLQTANLQNANLQEANLQKANLQKAELQKANFQKANLQEADLRRAEWGNNEKLEGANVLWVKSNHPPIVQMRSEQELLYKHLLLKMGQQSPESIFHPDKLPNELIEKIDTYLIQNSLVPKIV